MTSNKPSEKPKPQKIRNAGNNQFVLEESRKVGNYMMGSTIGSGTFGKVKIGIHILTGEKVAIKILEKARISNPLDMERVTREIQILKKVRHPNVVQLYEIIESPKHLFMILEYLRGAELFEYIVRNKRLNEREARLIFSNIISAVEYLHRIGVVHRDLKPENILIDFNLNVKIVDFGLSNMYNPKQAQLLKTACGSPCYAAPEMVQNKWYKPRMVDIWSTGIILYAMVCGFLPFDDPNTAVLYKKIASGQYKTPQNVSVELRSLISMMLQVHPDLRIDIDGIKKHFWLNFGPDPIRYQPGIFVGRDSIPIEMDVVQNEMSQMGFKEPKKILQMLLNNRHCQISTTYYLILKKKLAEGHPVNSDINNPDFNPALLNGILPLRSPKVRKEASFVGKAINEIENASTACTSLEKKDNEEKDVVIQEPNKPSEKLIRVKKSIKIEIPVEENEENEPKSTGIRCNNHQEMEAHRSTEKESQSYRGEPKLIMETKTDKTRAESETPHKETNDKKNSFRITSVGPSPKSKLDLNTSTISKRVHDITNLSFISSNTAGVNASFDKGNSRGSNLSKEKLLNFLDPSKAQKEDYKRETIGVKVSNILKLDTDQSKSGCQSSFRSKGAANTSFRIPSSFVSPRNKGKVGSSERSTLRDSKNENLKSFIREKISSNRDMDIRSGPREGPRQGNSRVPVLTMESVKRDLVSRMGAEKAKIIVGELSNAYAPRQTQERFSIGKGPSRANSRPRTSLKTSVNLRKSAERSNGFAIKQPKQEEKNQLLLLIDDY